MKQWPVKVTLPNGRDRLLMMTGQTSESAILAARHYIIQVMTEDGYLSGDDAAHEIEHYGFAISSKEEEARLRYHPFRRGSYMVTKTIHQQDTKDFAFATEVFQVGDEVRVIAAGMQFKVVKVTKKSIYGDDSKKASKLIDLLDRDIDLTRAGKTVRFRMEAIDNIETLYRWIRHGSNS